MAAGLDFRIVRYCLTLGFTGAGLMLVYEINSSAHFPFHPHSKSIPLHAMLPGFVAGVKEECKTVLLIPFIFPYFHDTPRCYILSPGFLSSCDGIFAYG